MISYDETYLRAPKPGETILAGDMARLLVNKLHSKGDKSGLLPEKPGQASLKADYSQYESTREFCQAEFRESYSPDILNVMDTVDKNTITIVKSANGVGKSHAAARIAVSFYKRFENVQVYTAAAPPEANLDMILWGQIKSLLAKYPEMFLDDNVTNSKFVGRKGDPLSYLVGLPIPQSSDPAQRKAKFSGKHAPVMVFLLDEGDGIPYEIYEAIESCMSGGRVHLIVFFNPRANVGPLATMERNGTGKVVEVSAFTHPNVVTGEDIYPGAVTREVTVRRINDWTKPLDAHETPDEECFEVPAFLVGCVATSHAGVLYPPLRAGFRRIQNPAFAYMVLAKYPAVGENQLISAAKIEECRQRWLKHVEMYGEMPSKACKPDMGADIAEMGVDSSCCALKWDKFIGKLRLRSKSNVGDTSDWLAQLYKMYNVRHANIDGNGVGAGVAPAMNRLKCKRVAGLKPQSKPEMKAFSPEQAELGEFDLLRDYMYWSVKHFIEEVPGAMIPDDEKLIEELVAATYEIRKGRIKVMSTDEFKEKLLRSPDRFTAVALACCGTLEEIAGELEMGNYVYNQDNSFKNGFVGGAFFDASVSTKVAAR